MNFLKDGLSIDEFKVSILTIMFVIFGCVGLYIYVQTSDMSDNMADIIKTFIYVIGGVNTINGVSKMIDGVKSNKSKTVTKGDA